MTCLYQFDEVTGTEASHCSLRIGNCILGSPATAPIVLEKSGVLKNAEAILGTSSLFWPQQRITSIAVQVISRVCAEHARSKFCVQEQVLKATPLLFAKEMASYCTAFADTDL